MMVAVSQEKLIEYVLRSTLPPVRRREAILTIRGISQQDIATRVDVSRQAVNQTIKGNKVSDPVMRASAEMVGVEVADLFPEFKFKPDREK